MQTTEKENYENGLKKRWQMENKRKKEKKKKRKYQKSTKLTEKKSKR